MGYVEHDNELAAMLRCEIETYKRRMANFSPMKPLEQAYFEGEIHGLRRAFLLIKPEPTAEDAACHLMAHSHEGETA